MTITIAIIGVATVVAAASVVVEYKKHVQLRRMNDLLAESLGHEPDIQRLQSIQHPQHGQGRFCRCHGNHHATCWVLSHRRRPSKRRLAHLGPQGRTGRSLTLAPSPRGPRALFCRGSGGTRPNTNQQGVNPCKST